MIRFRSPEVHDCRFAFATPQEATAFGRSHPRLKQAKADLPLLAEARLIDAWWTSTQLAFIFDNGRTLRTWLDDYVTAWEIVASDTVIRSGSAFTVKNGPEPCQFVFENACDEESRGPYDWDPTELIRSRIGERLYNLWGSPVSFKVYFENHPILNIGSMEDADTDELVMYFEDTD